MVAAGTAASTVGTMIKDRPRRLDLIYINQPLYFVTFATRDRGSIPSLHRAHLALERYGHRGIGKFSVALGLRDHARSCSFVRSRRSRLNALIVDWWSKARHVCRGKIAATLATWIL